jgi:hypothetical protein
MCPVIVEYRSCRPFQNYSIIWYAIEWLPSFVLSYPTCNMVLCRADQCQNLVQFTNGVIGEIEDGWQIDGVYTEFSKAFDRVLYGLLKLNLSILFGRLLLCWIGSDRSDTTCQIRGLFVRIDSMSIRGSAGESLGTNILHFGYLRGIGPLQKCECVEIR